ncbi:aconitase X swivel domain-containing protein [Paenibacillus thalictri]|uniref:aconitase X swivel domain-containing protein n=1 Tax=Paenibacillus thalictri TaxID=2527873 RepID=UPI0013EF07CA|nr:DUF126 domain-containing protein [Paenibacillus thalictri]
MTSTYGTTVEGEAVVIRGGFSPRYHLNRETGNFSFPGHPLDGQKVTGKILLCDFARGGVAAGWALNALKEMDIAPIALIFIRANPVMVQGAIFANLTIAEGLSQSDYHAIRTLDWVKVDPSQRQLIVDTRG